MSSSSHAFGLLVHWYRELLGKEAGRRWLERTAGRGMRAAHGNPLSRAAQADLWQRNASVEQLESRTLLATFTVTTADGLRQAILDANLTAAQDTIEIPISIVIGGISSGDFHLDAELPAITQPLIIAADPAAKATLNGSNLGAGSVGLRFNATVEVSGLTIYGFDTQIHLGSGSASSTVEYCYIGTDGISAKGGNIGIRADNVNYYRINYNTVSGLDGNAMVLNGTSFSLGNNRVGTNDAGTNAIPNGGVGIKLLDTRSAYLVGNVVCNNTIGIQLGSAGIPTTLADLRYNRIGISADDRDMGNEFMGVWIAYGLSNVLGYSADGSNIIAYNGSYITGDAIPEYSPGIDMPQGGVVITNGIRNVLIGNRFFANTGLGIDLGPLGVNGNDATDADGGANRRMNHPLIDSATNDNGFLVITGRIIGNKEANYRTNYVDSRIIDIYANDSADLSGFGEGEIYLGKVEKVMMETDGETAFTARIYQRGYLADAHSGYTFAATATQTFVYGGTTYYEDTSEFNSGTGRAEPAPHPLPEVTLSGPAAVQEGQTYTYTVHLSKIWDQTVNVYFSPDWTSADGSDIEVLQGSMNGSLYFNAGETEKTLCKFKVREDGYSEDTEQFGVSITSVGTAGIRGTPHQVVSTIAAQPPELTITGSNQLDTGANYTYRVSLSRAMGTDVTVDYAVVTGTADLADVSTNGSFSGSVTIPAGQVDAYLLDMAAVNDGDTGSESLHLVLSNPAGVVLGTGADLEITVSPYNPRTLATATRVGVGGEDPAVTISDAISTSTDVDLYYFIVTAGTTATFTINSNGNGLDSYLRLFDHSGVQLATNDDTYGSDAEITYTFAESGTYYIGVSTYSNTSYDPVYGTGHSVGSTGAYTLDITGLPMQDVTPATNNYDRFSNAWLVGNDQPIRSTFYNPGDYDLYEINVASRSERTRRFQVDAGGGSALKVFNSSGAVLYNSANDGTWAGVADVTLPGVGDYYVGISRQGNDTYNPTDVYPSTLSGGLGEYTFSMEAAVTPFGIDDGNLEQAIRDQLEADGNGIGLATLTETDMQSLTTLDASNRGIADLDGLEYATNLTDLRLSGNPISSLAPLAGLDLEVLYAGENDQLSDLTPLSGMSTLRELYVAFASGLSDLSPISGLTSLQQLYFYDTAVTDLSPLSGLTNLTYLSLDETNPSSLLPLQGLTSLKYLGLDTCQLSDADLAELDWSLLNIQDVNLEANEFSDLTPVVAMASLQGLFVGGNPNLTSLIPLSLCSSLVNLGIDGSPVADLSPLSGLTSLRSLVMSYTQVTSIAPLASLTGLTYLNMNGSPISDLSPVSGMVNMKTLYADSCQFTTVENVDWDNLAVLQNGSLAHNYLSIWPETAEYAVLTAVHNRASNFWFEPQFVVFTDTAFEAAARTALARPAESIYSMNMATLTSLDLSGQALGNIAGIEWATALTSVDLRNTHLDLSVGSPDRQRVDLLIARGVTVIVDVPPAVSIDANPSTSEGSSWSTTGNFTDPDADIWTATVDYGDGTGTQVLTLNADKTFTLSHRYDEVGSYTVTVLVDDGGDAPGSATTGVQIDPVAPSGSPWNDGPVLEGQPITVGFGSQSDPSNADVAAGFRYSFYFTGTPGAPAAGDIVDSANPEVMFTFASSGTHSVIARITDQHGAFNQYTVDLTVVNVAPVIVAGADANIKEGDTFTRTISFTDSGSAAEAYTANVDYGDGTIDKLVIGSGNTLLLSHQYTDNGNYAVVVSVYDGTDTGSVSFTVHCASVAPTGSLGLVGTAVEGAPATFRFTNQADLSSADMAAGFTYSYSLDGASSVAGGATYLLPGDRIPNGPSKHTLVGRITDKNGVFTEYSITFKVQNAAPVVTNPWHPAIPPGGTYTSAGSFRDSGLTDTWTAKVNYGDGSGNQPLSLTGKTFSLSHVYANVGVYIVTVSVTDSNGATGSANRRVTVNQVPPQMTSIIVNDGLAQRSMVSSITCNFSAPVTLDANAFSLIRSDGQAVTLSYSSAPASSVVLTFASGPLEGASLADGRYTFTVVGSRVHLGAATMSGTATQSITRLFGDADGDADVDSLDVKAFLSAYTKPRSNPAYRWYFDLNSNDVVDAADYKAFRLRLNKTV